MDLKQNAFLRRWICFTKPLLLGKANNFSLHSLTRGFAPINMGKYRKFLQLYLHIDNIIYIYPQKTMKTIVAHYGLHYN